MHGNFFRRLQMHISEKRNRLICRVWSGKPGKLALSFFPAWEKMPVKTQKRRGGGKNINAKTLSSSVLMALDICTAGHCQYLKRPTILTPPITPPTLNLLHTRTWWQWRVPSFPSLVYKCFAKIFRLSCGDEKSSAEVPWLHKQQTHCLFPFWEI